MLKVSRYQFKEAEHLAAGQLYGSEFERGIGESETLA
jgi:hypothetical protein